MRSRKSTRRFGLSLVITTVSALVLSACFPFSLLSQVQGETSVPFTEGAPAGFESYYAQPVEWTFCGVDVQCGTVQAPTDWSDPLSAPIELALTRHLASMQPAAGDLFVNPGGPGESAATFISESADRAVDSNLLEAYNIVGMDPRGVGASTQIGRASCRERVSSPV